MTRILVIDDDQDVLAVIIDTLRSAGYETVGALDGSQGIALHRDRPADVVVTDLLMPEKEGIETIRELKRADPDLRIIAMSGGGKSLKGTSYLSIAKELGANRVLSKPFSGQALLSAIEQLLSGETTAPQRG